MSNSMGLSVLMVDDERHCLEGLEWTLSEYCPEVIEIHSISDSREVATFLEAHEVDILFLDIDMPHMTGFEVLEQVQARNFHLVFTTAFDEYAVQAFKARAMDYLLKPIDKDELIAVIQRVQGKGDSRYSIKDEETKPRSKRIAICGTNGIEWLPIGEIVRCESDSNYTTIFMRQGERKVVSRTLKSLENELEGPMFVRVHRSHLVNVHFVRSLNVTMETVLILENEEEVPISRRRKAEVLQAMKALTGSQD